MDTSRVLKVRGGYCILGDSTKNDVRRAVGKLTGAIPLEQLKAGNRVARSGWNGKGMWLALARPDHVHYFGFEVQPYIAMKTADDKMQPGWLASQADMLATDWMTVP